MPLSGEIHWDIWVLWKDEILDILVLTRGQRARAAGGLCNAHSSTRVRCEIWRNRRVLRFFTKSRSDSSRSIASLSGASFSLLACLAAENVHLSRPFYSRVCSACVGGVLVLLSWVVGDQLNWANPETSMAQLDRGSLDHHLVLIPLIEAIVSFKNCAQWFSAMFASAYSRSQTFQVWEKEHTYHWECFYGQM